MPIWPTVREMILAAWFGPPIDPDYKAVCDRAAERELAWNQDYYGCAPSDPNE